jgi:hypothetical protein
MSPKSLVYLAPGLEPFAFAKGGDPLEFEKELVYCGDFVKDDLHFSVKPDDLTHWQATHRQFLDNGLECQLPIEHTENPEANRGKVIGMEVKPNKKGILALFGKVRFRDADAAKLASTANCSIFVPHEYKDGAGRTYKRPITHVALTDYPVVTGLEKFQPIAASFSTGTDMATAPAATTNASLMALAEKFAIPVAGKDDGTLQKDLDGLFTQMKADNDRYIALLKENDIDPASKPEAPAEGDGTPAPEAIAASHGPMLALMKKDRTRDIEELKRNGFVTPAVAADLIKDHCSNEALALSMKSGSSASFDSLVSSFKKNGPTVNFKQRTQAQNTIALSNGGKSEGGTSPLRKAAQKRADKAAKK